MDYSSVSSKSLCNPQISFSSRPLELIVKVESQAVKIILINPECSVIKFHLAIEKAEEVTKDSDFRVTERELEDFTTKDIIERRADDVSCRELLLTERESEVQKMEYFNARERWIEERDVAIQARERAMDTRENLMADRNFDVQYTEDGLKAQEHQIKKREVKTRAGDSMDIHEADMTAYEDSVAQRESEIQMAEEKLNARTESVCSRELIVANREASIKQYQEDLVAREKLISKRESEVKAAKEDIAACEVVVSKYKASIAAIEALFLEREQLIADLEKSNAERQSILEAEKVALINLKVEFSRLRRTTEMEWARREHILQEEIVLRQKENMKELGRREHEIYEQMDNDQTKYERTILDREAALIAWEADVHQREKVVVLRQFEIVQREGKLKALTMALANQKTTLEGHEEGTVVREATAQRDLDIFAVDQAEQNVLIEAQNAVVNFHETTVTEQEWARQNLEKELARQKLELGEYGKASVTREETVATREQEILNDLMDSYSVIMTPEGSENGDDGYGDDRDDIPGE